MRGGEHSRQRRREAHQCASVYGGRQTQAGGKVGGDEVESAALQPLSLVLRYRCNVTSTVGGNSKGASEKCTTHCVSPEATVAARETVRMSPTPQSPTPYYTYVAPRLQTLPT